MKLAFLISAHTDPQQLGRLVRALPSESVICIHVDAKADLSQFQQAVGNDARVVFLTERYRVMWGSFQQVRFQKALMRAALSAGADYLVTLSGLDYPVWSNRDIQQFFEQHQGREFIQGLDMTQQGEAARLYREYRLLNNHAWQYGTLRSKFRVSLRKTLTAVGVRKPLVINTPGRQYHLYKGSDWWAVSSHLARYMLDFLAREPAFERYFKNSFTPSETIWQTIAFQSDFADRCMLSTGPFTRLEDYAPLSYFDYTNGIKLLTETDYATITDSGKMVCRKVVSGRSDKLVAMIDARRNG